MTWRIWGMMLTVGAMLIIAIAAYNFWWGELK